MVYLEKMIGFFQVYLLVICFLLDEALIIHSDNPHN